ncbi:MAG TPA: glycosyltransferase family 4 protein [Thermoanaerobaculia bacterium]
MKILFTNNTLRWRAGSELYTLDLARRLLARGHRPIAFSTSLGPVAEELRRATIPVVDDLAKLSEPPDIIHAQHHFEAMIALLHFPGVPALFVCHGWLPWEETPLRFPRILRYVAVDDTTRDRLELEAGIPAGRIERFLSFVDLDRFRPRPPLPERPARALVFSNQVREEGFLPAVREACSRRRIALDVAGLAAGRVIDRPEEALPAYDLVFAKARCALEALAVGNAVVLCDHTGSGPLVTSAGLDRLRPLNFGIRTLQGPLSPEALGREIDRYDPADAARVSARIREEAGLDATADRYLDLYARILAEHQGRPGPSPEEEGPAAAAYVRWLDVQVKQRHALAAENEQLRAELAWIRGSAAWRWRERLVGIKTVRRLYRRLRHLDG